MNSHNVRRSLVALCAIVLVCVAVPGCSTPEKRWYAQRASLTSFQQSVLDAHAAGVVDNETLVSMDVGVRAARRWLDAAKPFLPAGGDTFDAYIASTIAVLAELSPILTQPEAIP